MRGKRLKKTPGPSGVISGAKDEEACVLPLARHLPFARLATLVRENRELKDALGRQLVELADLRQQLADTEEAAARAIADYDRELTATLAELDRLNGAPPDDETLRMLKEEACNA